LQEATDRRGVAIAAMGFQKEVARTIREEGAVYVLALKGNQASE